MKTALVTGATGLVGRNLIMELIADDNYSKLIVIARRELSIAHPKLEVIITDFSRLNEVKLPENINVCFCALGTTQRKSGREGMLKVDYEYVITLATICKNKGIKKFLVVSAKGANYHSRLFYFRTKGQMEEAVKKAGIETVYVVRPSLITGEREEFRFAEEMGYYASKLLSPLMVGRLKKMKPVSAYQIARCMIDLAGKDEKGNFTVESEMVQTY
ncbi:MAG: NAD(P)H-binding protein [Prolixibacteraceae bacterium]|nr:NAD(P)H-binding protein [Prolixibacteraceae bacterium]